MQGKLVGEQNRQAVLFHLSSEQDSMLYVIATKDIDNVLFNVFLYYVKTVPVSYSGKVF